MSVRNVPNRATREREPAPHATRRRLADVLAAGMDVRPPPAASTNPENRSRARYPFPPPEPTTTDYHRKETTNAT